ncbi:MAG TPA: hypothetical protein VHC22_15470 [Pirellulales bacterium]|nr:hypothetical protein [Pirellulales bacterium]
MGLRSFLSSLSENGSAQVGRPDEPLETTAGDADELLVEFDRVARQQLAFTTPKFSIEVARWAAELMYRGCQCLVYRDLGEDRVKQGLGVVCPRPLSADTIYSADLVLRYLVDLATMARAVAERDVLVAELMRLGTAWPLSSVGMSQIAANQLDGRAVEIVMADRCLRQLYADRIVTRRDAGRLEQAAVGAAVREAVGLYDELWPEVSDQGKSNQVMGNGQ